MLKFQLFKVIRVREARKYKGKLVYTGLKVKLDIDSLIKQNEDGNVLGSSYLEYLEEVRDTYFTIEFIAMKPSIGVVLNEFPHLLDLDDLLIK